MTGEGRSFHGKGMSWHRRSFMRVAGAGLTAVGWAPRGRARAVSPSAVVQFVPRETVDGVLHHRSKELVAYQDEKLAERYKALGLKLLPWAIGVGAPAGGTATVMVGIGPVYCEVHWARSRTT